MNSGLNVFDKSLNFTKILDNNYLKSYKILINLTNEYILTRDVMDIVYKIRNGETIEVSFLNAKLSQDKRILFEKEFYEKCDKILNEVQNQISLIDKNIAVQLAVTIYDSICNIITQLRNELNKYEAESGLSDGPQEIKKIINSVSEQEKLVKIKEQIIK